MFTVYVLHSIAHNKIYIGYTYDLDQRLISHNELATKGFTLRYRTWKVVYTEILETKQDTLRREKQLKTAKGRVFIWDLINRG
nr:GIY-YIG nuclease family protein [uncultured Pedobacter sp.]